MKDKESTEKKSPSEISPMDVAQWKVESKTDKYKRTYSTVVGAKRDYGMWCKEIEKDGHGEVEMFFRPNVKTEWVCIEEFSMDLGEDEDEDEDEDQDED